MEAKLEQLKLELKCVVVSSPTQMDLLTLMRDYETILGIPIPIAKFGFQDPMLFLKKYCSDCFLFKGPPSNPYIILIVTDNLKHIDELVLRQNISSKAFMKERRQSVLEADVERRTFTPRENSTAKLLYKNITTNISYSRKQLLPQDTLTVAAVHSGTIHQKSEHTYSVAKKNPTMPSQQTVKFSHNFVRNEKTVSRIRRGSMSQRYNSRHEDDFHDNLFRNFLIKRIIAHLKPPPNALPNKSNYGNSGNQETLDIRQRKHRIIQKIKSQVGEIINEYPEGVWCREIMPIYEARYGFELPYGLLGYMGVLSLATSVPGVRFVLQSAGDCLLVADDGTGKGPWRPPPLPPPPRVPRPPVDSDDALPGVPCDPLVFPEDCIHYTESIPKMSVDDIEPAAILEVRVVEAESPARFWLLRLGYKYENALENLVNEMNLYYGSGEGRERVLIYGARRVGQFCACCYETDWCRAVIKSVLKCGLIKILYVDYGTVEFVDAGKLRLLLRRWTTLPRQGLRARLAAVRTSACRWMPSACTAFRTAVLNISLVAIVRAIDQEGILEVLLLDRSTGEYRCVSAELIRSGHADSCADVPHGIDSFSTLVPDLRVLDDIRGKSGSDIKSCDITIDAAAFGVTVKSSVSDNKSSGGDIESSVTDTKISCNDVTSCSAETKSKLKLPKKKSRRNRKVSKKCSKN